MFPWRTGSTGKKGPAGRGGLYGTVVSLYLNRVLVCGRAVGGKLGRGWDNVDFYSYLACVRGATHIVQICPGSISSLLLNNNGQIIAAGGNGETGAAGVGYPGIPEEGAKKEIDNPTIVTGGVPLYSRETLHYKGITVDTGEAPLGPVLPTKAEVDAKEATFTIGAVAVGAAHCAALGTNGVPYTWGSGNGGALGNGWANDAAGSSAKASNQNGEPNGYGIVTAGSLTVTAATGEGHAWEVGDLVTTASAGLAIPGIARPTRITAVSGTTTKSNGKGDTTSASKTILNATNSWAIGDAIGGSGIPVNTTVTNVVGTTLTISNNATATKAKVGLSKLGKQTITLNTKATVSGTMELLRNGGEYSQMAPFPVLTGPGPASERCPEGQQTVAPGETNVLKNIAMMALATHLSVFVDKNGKDVYYSGSPTGPSTLSPGAEQRYAAKDPVWDAYRAANPSTPLIVALSTSRSFYTLLLADGTVRKVGNFIEYSRGDGVEASAKTNLREVVTPTLSTGAAITNVVAISNAEYSTKYVKTEEGGSLWTDGSNAELQQGLGQPENVPSKYVTKVSALNAGGRKVIAVSTNSEERGTGRNGAEFCIALLDDLTPRFAGWNWSPNTSAGPEQHYEGTGVLARADGANSSVFTPADPPVSNIVQIHAAPDVTMLLQEPGVPDPPEIDVSFPSPGKVLVKFRENPATLGVLPLMYQPTAWRLVLTGEGGTTGSYSSGKLPPAPPGTVNEWLVSVAPGTYNLTIAEDQEVSKPAVVGGATKPAVAGVPQTISWVDPPRAEPGFIVEGRWQAPAGKPAENWFRMPTNAAAGDRSMVVTPPVSKLGYTGNVEWLVTSNFEGMMKKRGVQVIVPA